MNKNTYICHFDGATLNSNPSNTYGVGWTISLGKEPPFIQTCERVDCFGTNNCAEYLGIIRILDYFLGGEFERQEIVIKGDSLMVINQINNKWKAKKGLYLEFSIEAKDKLSLLRDKNKVSVFWVAREENTLADFLSKKALT